MSSVVLSGDSSGSVTLTVPSAAGSNTVTIPAATGTALTDATVGVCRAWVNFNGTGTVAINASFNVSSITDNGTGDYTVNFTNAMSDANYNVCCTGFVLNNQSATYGFAVLTATASSTATLKSTSQLRVFSRASASVDLAEANVAVFR